MRESALVATAPGESGLWDTGSGLTCRQRTGGPADHRGLLVPATVDTLPGWGGLSAPTGVGVDIDT
ncbi:hypothetical protein ADL05_17995 [Nocardiopsis sp. NRRL B-16309]|nr:hypothetical protein ADL05_17995 [Nocardiopsis sp. NRRL B-16309]